MANCFFMFIGIGCSFLSILFILIAIVNLLTSSDADRNLILSSIIASLCFFFLAKWAFRKFSQRNKRPKICLNTQSSLLQTEYKQKYEEIFRKIFTSYIRSIYIFSDDEISDMFSIMSTGGSDFRDTVKWRDVIYERYLKNRKWTWVDFEKFKDIVYEMANHDLNIKKSYLWWVFKADTNPATLMPIVLKKLKVAERKEALINAGIPFEKGTKSAELAEIIFNHIPPEKFKTLTPTISEKFLEQEQERRLFLFHRFIEHIQYFTTNSYNLVIAQYRGQKAKIKNQKQYDLFIIGKMKQVPPFPPFFPCDQTIIS